jgi:lipopolysaccharide exporter
VTETPRTHTESADQAYERDQLRRASMAGVRWTGATAVTIAATQMLQLIVLSRLLRPADFGLVAMTMVVVQTAQAFSDAGLTNAVIRRQRMTAPVLSSLYWTSVGAGLIVAGVVWSAAPVAALFFREPDVTGLLRLAALTLVIVPIGQQFQALLQKELAFKPLARVEVLAAAAGTGVAIVLAARGAGAASVIWGQIALASVQAALFVRLGMQRWQPRIQFCWRDVRGVLGFGVYQMAERSLNTITGRVDQLLVGHLVGAQALGYYSLAFQVAIQPVMLINAVVGRVAFPAFARMQGDLPMVRASFPALVRTLNTFTAPAMLGLALVAPLLIPVAFGREWAPAVPLLQLFAAVAWHRSMGNPLGSLLLGQGRVDIAFRLNVSLFLITPGAVLAGIALGGASGAIIALLVVQFAYWAPSYFLIVRRLIGPVGAPYLSALVRPVAIAALMGLIVMAIGVAAPRSSSGLGAMVGVGVLTYAILLWVFDRRQYSVFAELIRRG